MVATSRSDARIAGGARTAIARAATLARARLRGALVSASGLLPNRRGSFTRCVYLHNVREDERRAFRNLLREMKNRGDVISTATLIGIVTGELSASGRHFHLSLDDGFAGAVGGAVAVMVDERVTASLFVATRKIVNDGDSVSLVGRAGPVPDGTPRMAAWKDVRAAHRAGFEIGSHTHTHVSLARVSSNPARLDLEVALSKAMIERQTGAPCDSIAWPLGRMTDIDERALEAIRLAGYTACFSGVRGSIAPGQTDQFMMPRHQIEAGWPLSQQRAFLAGRWEGRI